MTKIKGIYAASLSILNENLKLDIKRTIQHAEMLIDQGCHGAFSAYPFKKIFCSGQF